MCVVFLSAIGVLQIILMIDSPGNRCCLLWLKSCLWCWVGLSLCHLIQPTPGLQEWSLKNIMKQTNLLGWLIGSFGVVGIVGMPTIASAGSLTPATFSANLGIGDMVTVSKTVTTDLMPTTLDVFFLSDTTGSMGSVIDKVKASANDLLTQILAAYPNTQFAVGNYKGDPCESAGGIPPNCYAGSDPYNYQLQQAITNNTSLVTNAINAWAADGGGDAPEANFYALQQLAASSATGWRPEAAKYAIWFGDYPSHEETTTINEAITALKARGVTVLAFNSSGPGTGIDDGAAYGYTNFQSSTIASATNGTHDDNFYIVPQAAVVTTVLNALSTATSTIDINPTTVGDTSGLSILFNCTDPLGCTKVPGGESRTFDMKITGLLPGVYNFQTLVPGVTGAIENDKITVSVPEPSPTLSLLALGTLGAASTLKGKLNPCQSTEKETTKVS